MAHHLLEKGAALKAGETIGISDDEERIPIAVEPSRWDGAGTHHEAGSVTWAIPPG